MNTRILPAGQRPGAILSLAPGRNFNLKGSQTMIRGFVLFFGVAFLVSIVGAVLFPSIAWAIPLTISVLGCLILVVFWDDEL